MWKTFVSTVRMPKRPKPSEPKAKPHACLDGFRRVFRCPMMTQLEEGVKPSSLLVLYGPSKQAAEKLFNPDIHRPRFSAVCLSLGALSRRQRSALAPFATPVLIGHQHGCGHSNRGIGADEDADHQGEGEASQHLAAKEV
jgi:hypothetical protein